MSPVRHSCTTDCSTLPPIVSRCGSCCGPFTKQGGYMCPREETKDTRGADRPLTRGEWRADAARRWFGWNAMRLRASARPMSAPCTPAAPVVRQKRYRSSATMHDQHVHEKHLLAARYTMFGAWNVCPTLCGTYQPFAWMPETTLWTMHMPNNCPVSRLLYAGVAMAK